VDRDDASYFGVTNVGVNPTFGDNVLSIETHILDFSTDIVGERIRLTFLHRLRDEKRYGSVDELTRQIARDIRNARKWIEEKGGMKWNE
jgi:riboflavin kinase/FMN adenylyltransferase